MTTPEQYRQFADECMQAAREAKTDAERKVFLDMAKSWTKAAAQMTNGEAIAPPAVPASPKASP
jgi:hypothetical protein